MRVIGVRVYSSVLFVRSFGFYKLIEGIVAVVLACFILTSRVYIPFYIPYCIKVIVYFLEYQILIFVFCLDVF